MTATQQQNLAILIAATLQEQIESIRFGLLARNMPQFDPQTLYEAMQDELNAGNLRLALIGYTLSVPPNQECVTLAVEQAVAWRNDPDGSTTPIVVLLNPQNEPERIHSLEMLEPFTDADLRRSIVQRGAEIRNSPPV